MQVVSATVCDSSSAIQNGLWLLPQELWDHIINHLHIDRDTLKACVLTCRAWLQTARSHLWWSLAIHSASRTRSLRDFPGIAANVRVLRMFCKIAELPCLSVFTNLRHLNLYCMDDKQLEDPMTAVSQDFQLPSVVALFVMKSMQHQGLSTACLERTLRCFPNLTTLSVVIATNRNAVKRLRAALLPQTSNISLPHVQDLVITAGQLLPSLPAILRSAGTSLSSIMLHIPRALSGIHNLFDFSHNPNLQRMVICIPSFDAPDIGWGNALASPLSCISALHTSLTCLTIDVGCASPNTWDHASINPWADPGGPLAYEVARILDDLPLVVIVFSDAQSFAVHAARQVRRMTADYLLQRCPGLHAHSQRLRFSTELALCDCRRRLLCGGTYDEDKGTGGQGWYYPLLDPHT
ncbi:uncharacterized protein C8Q71DRAFT_738670 [Rhodofomes roseus]|uniref:F-box domain-containing protein n=1 Tax=Rhodofomes roseus TaxID=34475 RepID=A0ABQ8KT38_9APHY|nr:uncharacterized protein C8Q71DRAFT_738670 [Rhodofomes roseus]KAH9841755.1 hypothetical protein C8Q71DRAFT_738670 [Rhodofomes roseus]